ncbi:M23 family metallopeptidase [Actinoallomurus sp. NPDC050550]|uniref:M23 family metallopeptidase n=1 Tax=Actinoallomurus sp. NPDC050550 TaxID=3154937 RepID=UPI0033F28C51
MSKRWARTVALGKLLPLPGTVLMLVAAFGGLGPLWPAGLAVWVAGVAALFVRLRPAEREPVLVSPPVRGRWVAVNSPADRVPSHGVHAYGQTYAIDLVHHPDTEREWQGVRAAWPPTRSPERFPGFGRPVFAPVDGVVVRVRRRSRDHWSRDSVPGVIYLLVEGMVRELFGPGRLLGNHIVIAMDGGGYAVLAHLRRGSARVTAGQRVTAGEQIAECGNSGNSSEPHVHFQLMDAPHLLAAGGVPFRFDRFEIDGGPEAGVPGGRQPFTVPSSAPTPETGADRRG